MTAATERRNNGRRWALLLGIAALIIAVGLAIHFEARWDCVAVENGLCVPYPEDRKPWYGKWPWAIPTVAIPAAVAVGWLIGLSIPVEPDRQLSPSRPDRQPSQQVAISRDDARMIAREHMQVQGSYTLGAILWVVLMIAVAVGVLFIWPNTSTGLALVIGAVVGLFGSLAVVNRMIR